MPPGNAWHDERGSTSSATSKEPEGNDNATLRGSTPLLHFSSQPSSCRCAIMPRGSIGPRGRTRLSSSDKLKKTGFPVQRPLRRAGPRCHKSLGAKRLSVREAMVDASSSPERHGRCQDDKSGMGNLLNPRDCARPLYLQDGFSTSVACGRLDGLVLGLLLAVALVAFAWRTLSSARQDPEDPPRVSKAVVAAIAAAALAIPLSSWWLFGFFAGRRRLGYEGQMEGYRRHGVSDRDALQMMQNADLVAEQSAATLTAGSNIAAAIASQRS